MQNFIWIYSIWIKAPAILKQLQIKTSWNMMPKCRVEENRCFTSHEISAQTSCLYKAYPYSKIKNIPSANSVLLV